ncbi:ABC transporter permease [Methylocystis parvus]|uniref:FtsX-like permease family protein n=1 Tax=Methylocystis parvus TaxID=134 RepID=A0A6B8M1W6_9HYPH|nr:FtsX-like permease family protein [Methylocystis parvus]QGM98867.1 FtsX-like permease family protein [Methylocystis parvus]WBK00780.1 FtsX-like permease family protein [Methylocystis parvus OBBP]
MHRRIQSKLPFGLRFALRDLLGDPRGFGVFVACIVIGVAAISGVSGLSRSLAEGLAREGRTILGGDASFSLVARELSPEQRAFFETRGRICEISLMRAMARRDDGEAAMVEIKAVDPATYPAFGAVTLDPATPLDDALAEKDGVAGIVVDPILLARLDVKLGDTLLIGNSRVQLRAKLLNEPDKLAGGVGFGPRVMMTRAALKASGLVTPGTVVRNATRITLAGNAADEDVKAFVKAADAAFPRAGWEARTRDAVSPQFSRNLDRFTQLLTLVALTALVAGGAGVANAVHGFVERKRMQFAVLKALGATGSRVFAIALTQVMAAAAFAILLGLAVGALIPWAAAGALREAAELPVSAAMDARGALFGALYGLLVTLIFALIPLGRAHEAPVAALLRDDARSVKLTRYRAAAFIAAVALAALATVSSADLKLGAAYVGAAVAAFAALRGAASLTMRAARALPRPRDARLRLALANIWRPKSLTPALIVSIGLTQTLLVALALVEGSVHNELARADAGEIPNFFFVDTPKSQAQAFAAFLAEQVPDARIEHVPMMRGRMVEVKGAPVGKIAVADDQKWAFEGDRGVTFSASLPANSQLAEGEWWPADYDGPPLVSLEQKVAEGIGVGIGDDVKVNVLGRELIAKVASLRKVDWRSYAINFIMVFSPNAFRGAPYTELFTVAYGAPSAEIRDAMDARLARETAKRFPMIVSVRVKEALQAIDKIADQLALAARAAAGLAIVTAMLALASAVASGQRARIHDAVVLKTLGATRGWLAAAYGFEFGLVGLVASLIALAAGIGAAYAMVTLVMKIDFAFPIAAIVATTVGTLLVTIGLGLAGTWRALSRRPGPELREL